jgi:hypothetical protein
MASIGDSLKVLGGAGQSGDGKQRQERPSFSKEKEAKRLLVLRARARGVPLIAPAGGH